MVMSRQAEPGVRRHKSRRLCTSCYPRVLQRGELENYPRLRRSGDEVLDEYEHLREQGVDNLSVLARQLGLTSGARRDGDNRVKDKPPIRGDPS